jgi:hypothetical protein
MPEYTVRFHADFGYAEETIEAETPEYALEKARAMQEEDLLFERYDGYGDIEEIEVFEDGEELAPTPTAHWLSPETYVRLAAPDMLEALQYIENHCSELWAQDEKYRAGIAYIMDAARAAIDKATGETP